MRIRYCTRCLYPETKPDLWFDEHGVCSACLNYQNRAGVDWSERRAEFKALIERSRAAGKRAYDCVVPVSGGKDSTYQVLRLLEEGMRPLCVTATTCSLTSLGRENLDNLIRLGVDHVQVTVNPRVRRTLNKLALETIGDVSWPEHVGIFTIPIRVALQYGVRLVVWGENPQNEYGGPKGAAGSQVLDRRWLEEFGGLLGLRTSDLQGQNGLCEADLIQYTYPAAEEIKAANLSSIFIGYYFPWDGYSNALIAKAHGFKTVGGLVEGSLADYENLDNYQTGIHDYFKYLKYGFGRATDIACNHIRRGRLLRADAQRMVRRHDGRYPSTYLDKPLADILAEIDVSVDDFNRICDRFTNRKLFVTNNNGELVRDQDGSLIKVNHDNEQP